MERSVVFVHGTGVRAESYSSTFEVVRAQLGSPGREVRGCFWGAEEGVKLACGGASIPDYHGSKGGKTDPSAEAIAVWGVLYTDPGHELRLLGLRPPVASGMGRGIPPSEKFLSAIKAFQPSAETLATFRKYGLVDDLGEALEAVRTSFELEDSAVSVDENGYEHRHAVARAVVAATLAGAVERGADAMDGVARDALLAALSSDLHSKNRGIPVKVKTALGRFAMRAVANRRGSMTDKSLPMIGDILRYQSRGEGVRQLIKRTIEHTPGDKITLLAHSLGGVACVDLLAMHDLSDRVDQLITVGSQAPFFYECGALTSVEHPATLPDHFPRRWLNLYDPWDLLAYRAGEVFPLHAADKEINSGQPFPLAHSAYWTRADVWDAISTWLS